MASHLFGRQASSDIWMPLPFLDCVLNYLRRPPLRFRKRLWGRKIHEFTKQIWSWKMWHQVLKESPHQSPCRLPYIIYNNDNRQRRGGRSSIMGDKKMRGGILAWKLLSKIEVQQFFENTWDPSSPSTSSNEMSLNVMEIHSFDMQSLQR